MTIIPEDVRRAFDSAVVTIKALEAEAVELEKKFGNRSTLFQNKVAQVQTLRTFYKTAADYLEHVHTVAHYMAVNNIAAEIMLMQKETTLPFGQCAKILGYEFTKEQSKGIEEIDDLIEQVFKVMQK